MSSIQRNLCKIENLLKKFKKFVPTREVYEKKT